MMLAPLIPDNAPFTPEQRAWLNGFFAGLVSLDDNGASAEAGISVPAELARAAAREDDGAPWHDPTLPMVERMKLAEGRPLRRRMMAAMAQQDCGQCGYDCENYANAIWERTEKRLNLCVPGGKETARMLKKLYAEMNDESAGTGGSGAGKVSVPAAAAAPASAAPSGAQSGRTREKPVLATFLGARRLNGPGSEKNTCHVTFDLSGLGLSYRPGDSFGVLPSNDPELVDSIISHLGGDPDAEVGDGNGHSRGLRDALLNDVSLAPAPDALFELLAGLTNDPDEKIKLQAMAEGEDPDGDLETLDVLAALERVTHLKPSPQSLVATLEPLQPRLYSIASSPRRWPDQLHLAVDVVRHAVNGRLRKGVASSFLAERLRPGDRMPVYVQDSHGFALPENPATPIIMVGPGTGIAPFRAFLHDREAHGATGKSWLFFGHQRRACDFFYQDELEAFARSGALTHLSTAFSRDQDRKIYVQDRMVEEGAELFRWLDDGAVFYVCGDAKRMAPDVDCALHRIVAKHGGMGEARARAYIQELSETGRYRKDVY